MTASEVTASVSLLATTTQDAAGNQMASYSCWQTRRLWLTSPLSPPTLTPSLLYSDLQLSETLFKVIDNILQVQTDVLQTSQETANTSSR